MRIYALYPIPQRGRQPSFCLLREIWSNHSFSRLFRLQKRRDCTMIAFPFREGVISVSSKDGTEMTDEVFKLICKVLVETRYYNHVVSFVQYSPLGLHQPFVFKDSRGRLSLQFAIEIHVPPHPTAIKIAVGQAKKQYLPRCSHQ